MSHYRRYPAYKDSGVEWLGEVPEHWVTIQLGKLSTSRCDGPFGSGLKSEHYVESGVRVVRLQNIGFAKFNGGDAAYISADYWREELGGGHDVLPGDVLVAGLGDENNPLGRACVVPPTIAPAMVKADCYRFRLSPHVNPEFVALALSATARTECGYLATGATRDRLNLTLASARKLALPPPPEQHAITAALDRETARIDALIAKKVRFIELLKEKRQALITRAVTKGLDPTAKMKDSGVEWIGEVPEHWRVVRLKHVLAAPLQYGANESGEENGDDDIRYIRITDLDDLGELRNDSVKRLPLNTAAPYLLKTGDILFARSGATVGKTYRHKEANGPACFAGYLIRARPDSAAALSEFVTYAVRSHYYWAYIQQTTIQATT